MVRTLQYVASSRNPVKTIPHDRSSLLWSGNLETGGATDLFLNSIDGWVDAMVSDEHGGGGGPEGEAVARVVSRQPGRVCGIPVIERLLERHFDECKIEWHVTEGRGISEGGVILELLGSSIQALQAERILLNILGGLSGIATNVALWSEVAGEIGVAATRKADWGLLDKWAVHVGGGLTHRLSRGDALMIKENDLAAMRDGESDADALTRVVTSMDMDKHAEFTVFEVREAEQALVVASAWSRVQKIRSGGERVVLLLDNMGPEGALHIDEVLSKSHLRHWCVLEGSGGVELDSLSEWSESGVDVVSSSALNRGVAPLDLSMLFEGGG
jgi:nicotinate-nucleotide pyrophosphorylase (carboxylating)